MIAKENVKFIAYLIQQSTCNIFRIQLETLIKLALSTEFSLSSFYFNYPRIFFLDFLLCSKHVDERAPSDLKRRSVDWKDVMGSAWDNFSEVVSSRYIFFADGN